MKYTPTVSGWHECVPSIAPSKNLQPRKGCNKHDQREGVCRRHGAKRAKLASMAQIKGSLCIKPLVTNDAPALKSPKEETRQDLLNGGLASCFMWKRGFGYSMG